MSKHSSSARLAVLLFRRSGGTLSPADGFLKYVKSLRFATGRSFFSLPARRRIRTDRTDAPMAHEPPQRLIADLSTLTDFLWIHRLDLLTRLPYKLLVADVVRDQIQRGYPSNQVEQALAQGECEVVALSTPAELEPIARLRHAGLSTGEAVGIMI